MHRGSDVGPRGFNEEVVVVSHEAVAVADEPISSAGVAHESEKRFPIRVVQIDVLAHVPASRDVVDEPGELWTVRATHAWTRLRIQVEHVRHKMPRSARRAANLDLVPMSASVASRDHVRISEPRNGMDQVQVAQA